LAGNTISVSGSNVGATGEPGEPNHAGSSQGINGELNSVWWTWTATADGQVSVDTFGSDYNTTLAVYTGDAVNALLLQAENDDFSNDPENPVLQSRVNFDVTAGTRYFIAVDGFQDETGAIDLNLAFTPTNHLPQIDNQTFAVDEHSAAGTVVGTVLA